MFAFEIYKYFCAHQYDFPTRPVNKAVVLFCLLAEVKFTDWILKNTNQARLPLSAVTVNSPICWFTAGVTRCVVLSGQSKLSWHAALCFMTHELCGRPWQQQWTKPVKTVSPFPPSYQWRSKSCYQKTFFVKVTGLEMFLVHFLNFKQKWNQWNLNRCGYAAWTGRSKPVRWDFCVSRW